MPPQLTLEGNTLGEKRRHFNKLVEDAIANKNYELRNISSDDSDLENLLKIEIASRTRNVDYIIEVMKSNDMLYAATAIKKSTWLITEPQYANIINPEYLHTQLLPNMNTKTFNKLMLHIRLSLKDESRVEEFYEYLRGSDSSYKWLQHCSIPFTENVIKHERLVPLSLFKRLCRKSPNFIAYFPRVIEGRRRYSSKQQILSYIKLHTEKVMHTLEHDELYYFYNIKMDKKKTEFLMKAHSQKVFDKFEKYVNVIDLAVAAKHINNTEIKTFLKKQMLSEICRHSLFDDHKLGYFIKYMPENERIEFVRKTFIDKTGLAAFYPDYRLNHWPMKTYKWYEFVPFSVAFSELQKLIRNETSFSERCAMLSVLITCAGRNPHHIKTLLKYVNEKHINEPFTFKIKFINNLLSQVSTLKFDVETWNILEQFFLSMEVYSECENDVQICLENIVLHNVLHDELVPENIKQKLSFNTFQSFQSKLNENQRSKMFTYLFNSVLAEVKLENIETEADFSHTIEQLKNVLILLKYWKRDINKYPFVLEKVQELIKIKQEYMWKTDLSCLYNVKKSWRKYMFEDSLSLCLNEESCLNALKHKPQLLTLHEEEIDTLRTNDAVSLRRLLAKLRVYWPHSLAQHWTDAYLLNLKKPVGHKAVIKGLFTLLPKNEIIEIAKQHIPDETKVNWGTTDQIEISIKKNIAKNLHIARPLIPLDTVLWYAKGDYLQHAVPSLNALLPNLNEAESHYYLPKLLDAPASLQKFGLNLAVSKLKSKDLKTIFSNVWKTSKNLTIRSVLFKHTYYQICKADNPCMQKELWQLLSSFIGNLTAEESAEIYKKIGYIQNVPISIRAEFYTKSYEFLTTLPASANCDSIVNGLIEYAPKAMELLDKDFVPNKMLSPVETKFCSYESKYLKVFACYVLCGKSEEDQLRRYKRIVEPAMDKAFRLWDTFREGQFYIKDNFNKFLQSLVFNFRLYALTLNNKIIPVKLFLKIKTKMEKELPLLENYVLHTSWKLVTEYVQKLYELKCVFPTLEPHYYGWMTHEMDCIWKDIHIKASPIFGPIIVQFLKEDIERFHCTTIYHLFAKAIDKMFKELFGFKDADVLETLRHMLNDNDCVESYLVVSNLTPQNSYFWSDCKPMRSEIRKILESHPSKAVQIQCSNDFLNIPEDTAVATELNDD